LAGILFIMTSFRFIHAADIHIDSPLRGLSVRDGSAGARIRLATRTAFERLISTAIEEEVAFLVIAGDLYDGDWRDFHTGLFFVEQMGRLANANIQAFVLFGNHDAESQITRRLPLPPNVKVFSARKPETNRLDELGVALHGQSFRQRDVMDNLAAGYPEPVPGLFNIGVLHTALDGHTEHASYAPCSLAELLAKGYDYWALGHVHKGQVLHQRPHVVFPGNLQGRHIRETGAKGAHLVTVVDREITEFVSLPCDVVRWARIGVDVSACGSMSDVHDLVRAALEAECADAENRLLACRIELIGRTALHGEFVAMLETLQAEAQAAALGLGEDVAWIERLVVATRAPGKTEATAQSPEALSQLQEMLAGAPDDEELAQRLSGDLGEFVRKLPPEIRSDPDDPLLAAALAGGHRALLDEVQAFLHARLLAPEE
jgi:DNA repair exonuclease SbcCD nuclease subunit